MAKITDVHIRKLFRLMDQGVSLFQAAQKTGIDRKTARRYWIMKRLPSDQDHPQRNWRTRPDPFAGVWAELEEQLRAAPHLQAKTLLCWLQRKYPGRFEDSQLRTLQRQVHTWRATQGPAKEVFFGQVHEPGRLCASDFTHMTSLRVTIAGQVFDHLVYHFVLTYSNWESVTICFSESLESLSEGLQNALWQLGGVPLRHRSDRMSSAVKNLSDHRDFTARYQALLNHYGLMGEKINAREAHENGDVESSHRHFKDAVEQALLLRGSRDFVSREAYAAFLEEVKRPRNRQRQRRLAEEQAVLRPLPTRRLESCQRLRVTVSSGSLIRVQNNVYSVNSRLIGESVEVRIYAEHLQVWYGQQCVEQLPRLRGRCKQRIDYRHVIDWLVRKPGALAQYRFREELFPTSRFRLAYDVLHETQSPRADREYLQILHLAATESEEAVAEALRLLLDQAEAVLSAAAVEALVRRQTCVPAATEVQVEAANLADFDELLTNKEGWHDGEHGCEGTADSLLERAASADDPGLFRGSGSACPAGDAVLRAIPAGADSCGERCQVCAPDRAVSPAIADPAGEGSGEFRSQASTGGGGSPSAYTAGWNLSGPPRESVDLWESGVRQNTSRLRVISRVDSRWPQGLLPHVQLVGAGIVGCQAGLETEPSVETLEPFRGIHHRRHRLCATKPRGDGGIVHVVGGALRAWQRADHQQLTVLEVGGDFQRPDDHGGGNRPLGSSQRDLGTEHSELSLGTGQEGQGSGRDRIELRYAAKVRVTVIRVRPGVGPGSAPRPVAALRTAPLRQAPPPRSGSPAWWLPPLSLGISNCR